MGNTSLLSAVYGYNNIKDEQCSDKKCELEQCAGLRLINRPACHSSQPPDQPPNTAQALLLFSSFCFALQLVATGQHFTATHLSLSFSLFSPQQVIHFSTWLTIRCTLRIALLRLHCFRCISPHCEMQCKQCSVSSAYCTVQL